MLFLTSYLIFKIFFVLFPFFGSWSHRCGPKKCKPTAGQFSPTLSSLEIWVFKVNFGGDIVFTWKTKTRMFKDRHKCSLFFYRTMVRPPHISREWRVTDHDSDRGVNRTLFSIKASAPWWAWGNETWTPHVTITCAWSASWFLLFMQNLTHPRLSKLFH